MAGDINKPHGNSENNLSLPDIIERLKKASPDQLTEISKILGSQENSHEGHESRELLEVENKEITKKIQKKALELIQNCGYNGRSTDSLPHMHNPIYEPDKTQLGYYHWDVDKLHAAFWNPRFTIKNPKTRMTTTVTVVMKDLVLDNGKISGELIPLKTDIVTTIPVYNEEQWSFKNIEFKNEETPDSDSDLKEMIAQKQQLYSDLLEHSE